jgi:hypothetical protein
MNCNIQQYIVFDRIAFNTRASEMLLWLCTMLLTLPGFAQQYHFRQYDVMDGLPGSFVYRIVEDENGKLLISTSKGLAVYNGSTFKGVGPKDGFSGIALFHYQKDTIEHCLWFISVEDKLFRYKDGKFKEMLKDQHFCWMDIDRVSGEKWLMNRQGQIFRLSGDKATLFPGFKADQRLLKEYPGNNGAVTFSALGKGTFIVGTGVGFYYVSQSGQSFLPIAIHTHRTMMLPRVFHRLNGDILLAGEEGIYRFDKTSYAVMRLLTLDKTEAGILVEDDQTGDAWLGTSKGLFRFPHGVIADKKEERYLESDNITTIFRDSEGMYWFGSRENGLFNCNTHSIHYTSIKSNVSFLGRNEDVIYAGSRNGTLVGIEKNKVFRRTLPDGGGNVRKFIQLSNGLVLVMSTDPYLIGNKKTFHVPLDIATEQDWGRWHTKDSVIYYEWANEKKNIVNKKQLQLMFKRYPDLPGGSPQFIDNRGALYYVANMTIYKFSFSDKSIKCLRFPLDCRSLNVCGMFNDNMLVVSTESKGIALLKNDSISWINTDQGLISDYCTMAKTDGSTIWVCTNAGLSRLSMARNGTVRSISNFTADNVLLKNDVTDVLPFNDSIYVSSSLGISCFPANYVVPDASYHCYIEKLEVNNHDTDVHSGYMLPYDQNNFSITLGQSSRQLKGNSWYRYMLSRDGGDENPVIIKSNILNLASIEPGSYTLSVWSRNINGVWSAKPARLDFTIDPPFWKTLWFKLIVVGILACIALVILYMYQRRQRKKAEVARMLVESDLRSLRLHMNPHFIFNSLTSLQSFIVTNKTDKAEEYISSFSEVIRSVMGYSISGEITLTEEVKLLSQYIELEQIRFEDQFSYTITIEEGIIAGGTIIPSLLIQPIVENAIKHGLTGMNRKGNLDIHFEMRGNLLYCTVEDNGRGRNNATVKFNKVSGHVSTGIRFTEERIRLLIKNDSIQPVTVTDLVEGNKPVGTKVSIVIPVLE